MSRLTDFILRMAMKHVACRPPDLVIGGADNPYLLRWYVIPRNRAFNVYLHRFRRSDDDRALHDHPWWNVSVLLKGRYVEHTIAPGGVHIRTERSAGAIKFRRAGAAHRIELLPRTVRMITADGPKTLRSEAPCWTLFITGPRIRDWGFHCPRGWVHWREFTSGPRGETIGKGCGETE